MHIVLFGGSFNPPHLGHLIVIEQAFELIDRIDRLWILPAYRHTFQKDLAPSHHRQQMTLLLGKTLAKNIKPKVKINPIEIEHKLSGETLDTLQLLNQEHPEHEFSFLMGSDQLKDFKKWGSWEELLQKLPFHIYPRSGHRKKIDFPNMSLLESDTQVVSNLSSTLIRKRIKKALPIEHLIPKPILKYIRIHKIY